MSNIIELKQIKRLFRTSEIETIALENVNLEVAEGEFVAIMGPSGCEETILSPSFSLSRVLAFLSCSVW